MKEDLKSQHELIISRVKNAAIAGIDAIQYLRPAQAAIQTNHTNETDCRRVFLIGSSYGCYGALLGLIPKLQPDLPAAFVSVLQASPQHVDAFAQYLDWHSTMAVYRAVDGQAIHSGACYLTSVFESVVVKKEDDQLFLQVRLNSAAGPEYATDRLMASFADVLKDRATAILLSGIGEDGLTGIGHILKGAGNAIVQDPKTCLCGDTNAKAVERYGLSTVLPGLDMAEAVRNYCLNNGY